MGIFDFFKKVIGGGKDSAASYGGRYGSELSSIQLRREFEESNAILIEERGKERIRKAEYVSLYYETSQNFRITILERDLRANKDTLVITDLARIRWDEGEIHAEIVGERGVDFNRACAIVQKLLRQACSVDAEKLLLNYPNTSESPEKITLQDMIDEFYSKLNSAKWVNYRHSNGIYEIEVSQSGDQRESEVIFKIDGSWVGFGVEPYYGSNTPRITLPFPLYRADFRRMLETSYAKAVESQQRSSVREASSEEG